MGTTLPISRYTCGILVVVVVLCPCPSFAPDWGFYRLSGVRCPSVDDVPPPAAPTPPDVLEQQSPFGNRSKADGVNGAAGRKVTEPIASVPTEKPKGKMIDPKDFFRASAGVGAAGAGAKDKGKGKGSVKAEPKRAEDIGAFFRKGNRNVCAGVGSGHGLCYEARYEGRGVRRPARSLRLGLTDPALISK